MVCGEQAVKRPKPATAPTTMRSHVLAAGAALVILAVACLVAILSVEPSPAPTAPGPPPVPPEVTAAVAAAREAAAREAKAKQEEAEAAAREAAAREAAAARRAAAEAAAREAAAREAAGKTMPEKERLDVEQVADAGAKDLDSAVAGAAPADGAGGAPAPAVQRNAESQDGRESGSTPGRSGEPGGAASISARLDELRPRLSQCYSRSTTPAAPPPAAAIEGARSPVFLVQLERAGEHYRVVEATAESRGDAADAVLDCMRAVLIGATIPSPAGDGADRIALRVSP